MFQLDVLLKALFGEKVAARNLAPFHRRADPAAFRSAESIELQKNFDT